MSQLELSLIHNDSATQSRASLNLKLIDEYAEAMTEGAKFPPVTVFSDGIHYWLADGFHRLEAAKKIGSPNIAVEIRLGSRRDAVLYSVGANATHGLRRSNIDKRRAVLTLLSDPEWSQWSNNEVAKRCGVAEWLVRNLKKELSSFFTKIDHAYARKNGVNEDTLRAVQQTLMAQSQKCTAQRQGTTYTISVANIGTHNNRITPTQKSGSIEVLKAKPTHETFAGADRSEPKATKAIARLPEECPQVVAAESKLEVSYVPREPLNESFHIINIEQESFQQLENLIQTFEVTFPGVRVKIEGRPDALVSLFQKMQDNPTFAEEIWRQTRINPSTPGVTENNGSVKDHHLLGVG